MVMYRVKITLQAKVHLQMIRDYLAHALREPEIAKQILTLLRREIASLSTMPKRAAIIDEAPWNDMGLRKIRVKNYYIYFWIDEENNEVQILAVIYVRRDQTRQLEKLNIKKV